ncbi:hypothetical protein FTX61_08710 [Nitriliruptoraceae bacterium ZYF776]|nr:hypothetical protein [Profundirhabdus halotolerans]
MIDPTVVAVLVVTGVAALALATVVAAREDAPVAGRRASRLAPVVPWLGTLLVVLLLVRGALAGAVVVGLATLLHAVVSRARAVTGTRRR